MKKDLFRRNTRMVHRFGEAERDDALGSGTFDPQFPKNVTTHRSKSLTPQKHGTYNYCEPLSPVVTPTGRKTSLNGPAPDYAGEAVAVIPANSKKRKSP